MATGLYARVGKRFPNSAVAGQTGAGALESQGGSYNPAHGQDVTGDVSSTLPGFQPEPVAEPDVLILDGAFGLPGGTNPDETPDTHAAPFPGWAGSYAPSEELDALHQSSMDIHSADFGALDPRMNSSDAEAQPDFDIGQVDSPGASVLQPVGGQLRFMGGFDATQGYGGGADGPGGTNSYGFANVKRTYIRGANPQPMSYLDPAERPFIVPQASGTFTPTDDVQGPSPVGTFINAPGINYDAPSAYQPAPEPETLQTPLVEAPVGHGW